MNITLKINGMSCNHCVQRISTALSDIKGITTVSVDLAKGEAFVEGEALNSKQLIEVLDDLGFDSEEK